MILFLEDKMVVSLTTLFMESVVKGPPYARNFGSSTFSYKDGQIFQPLFDIQLFILAGCRQMQYLCVHG